MLRRLNFDSGNFLARDSPQKIIRRREKEELSKFHKSQVDFPHRVIVNSREQLRRVPRRKYRALRV
jgi:hypothetical protein